MGVFFSIKGGFAFGLLNTPGNVKSGQCCLNSENTWKYTCRGVYPKVFDNFYTSNSSTGFGKELFPFVAGR